MDTDVNQMILMEKLERLKAQITQKGNLLVAFSGGVDSGLLLKVAHDALAANVLAVTIDSELFPKHELEGAMRFLNASDIPYKMVQFSPLRNEAIARNQHDRCYYCKRDCARLLNDVAVEEGITTIAEGVTVSDIDEYRPGIAASREEGLWHPLVEVGITKQEVRQIAKAIELPFWDKQPSPCLATRIEYDERITWERLNMIEEAESILKSIGCRQLRVRLHHDGIARIEVAKADFTALFDVLETVSQKLKTLGFNYVTLDLEGYRRGSMDLEKPHT